MTCYAQSDEECRKRGGACSTHPRDAHHREAVKRLSEVDDLYEIENEIAVRSERFRTFKSSDEKKRYMILALAGEIGEAANIVKKNWRGDLAWAKGSPALKDELSDVFVYWVLSCHANGWTMQEMAVHANAKAERKIREVEAERAAR